MALSWERDGRDWPQRDTSRFVDAGGVRWHVQRSARPGAPTVLLLHGTGAATHSWRHLFPLLQAHCDLIAPDLPGHGFSGPLADAAGWSLPGMAAATAALLEALDAAPAMLVGHSAGAAIAARIALDARWRGAPPPRLVVGLNAALLPWSGVAGAWFSPIARALARHAWVPRLFARRARDPAAMRRLLDGTGSQIDAFGRELYRRVVSDPDHVAAALAMMAAWDLKGLVGELADARVPLHLVVGDRDATVPPDQAWSVRERVPGATIERFAGLGHLAHEEAGAAIAEHLLAVGRAKGLFAAMPPIVKMA